MVNKRRIKSFEKNKKKNKNGGDKIGRIIKLTTMVCAVIILAIPVVGATTNNSNSYDYNFCKGFAYGEIEDYKLSLLAQIIYFLRGKPSTLPITRGKIVIRQEPDMISLELINLINNYVKTFYGNITIYFYASLETINLDAVEPCPNCTHMICWGIFGHIHIEQN